MNTGQQSGADSIRAFVQSHYFARARAQQQTTVRIRSGDVHKEMGLVSRMPSVCSVLDSRKTHERFGIKLVQRQGPSAGASVEYVFLLLPTRHDLPPTNVVQTFEHETQSGRLNLSRSTEPIAATGTSTLHHLPTAGVFLVSCVKLKRSVPSPAKELYVSDWFNKARFAVEATGCPWFILSAKYGLVEPNTVIAGYDKTLNAMGVAERRAWAERVFLQIREQFAQPPHFAILAGMKYREFLASLLLEWGATIEVPLEGLRSGEQKQWLRQAT